MRYKACAQLNNTFVAIERISMQMQMYMNTAKDGIEARWLNQKRKYLDTRCGRTEKQDKFVTVRLPAHDAFLITCSASRTSPRGQFSLRSKTSSQVHVLPTILATSYYSNRTIVFEKDASKGDVTVWVNHSRIGEMMNKLEGDQPTTRPNLHQKPIRPPECYGYKLPIGCSMVWNGLTASYGDCGGPLGCSARQDEVTMLRNAAKYRRRQPNGALIFRPTMVAAKFSRAIKQISAAESGVDLCWQTTTAPEFYRKLGFKAISDTIYGNEQGDVRQWAYLDKSISSPVDVQYLD
ncbi:hypothetical protein B0H11DRAFT_1944124 [Mycena galericulata]|nr:hypothetical protein B0H11DRAFT_1944124 [Mycena galericulata]